MSTNITLVNMIPNLSSGESNQDSEPNLAVNPANPMEIAATAFTPSPNVGSTKSPIYYSSDGGNTWSLKDLIAHTPVRDQTLRFANTGGMLYAGVLWGGGSAISAINFDILRTNDFSGLTTMQTLASRKNDDQPFIQAATVLSGADTGKDRIYVGSNDHAPANVPSTIDLSLDAAVAAPLTKTVVLESRAVIRDGYQTRPAIHSDGTIYAVFYALVSGGLTCDVVVVRDDNWADGASPFNALIDPGDTKQGIRIATGINNPFLSLYIGQQRIGGDLAIIVDPNNSAKVYVCFGDLQGADYILRVWKSLDSGASWIQDIRTIENATNPSLAINSKGKLGFLYQQVKGNSPTQRWLTTIEFTEDDFGFFTTHILANTPAGTPVAAGSPYLGDYLYMMTVDTTFYGIFCANNTPDLTNFPNGVTYQRNANFGSKTLLANDNATPVAVSIDPFFFKITLGTSKVVTAIADSGNFGDRCKGSFVDEALTINNSGTGPLLISSIVSSSPDFLVPSVISYPMKVHEGDSIELAIRFEPTHTGFKTATITINSNDPAGPHTIKVFGNCPVPRLSLAISDHGNFGNVCVGSFIDELLILNNSSKCTISITAINSSSGDFLVPQVLSLPLLVGPGDSLPLPIRFAPASLGAKNGTITLQSNDPASPSTIDVSGNAPSGKLAVSGSLCFGGVKACCSAERTISICNIGDCKLHVSSVAFKKKNRHWKLINNPFPAALHAGSCLSVVVRYRACEKCPRCCELVIISDDPNDPVKTLEVLAYTDWNRGCNHDSGDCKKGCREKNCPDSCDDCDDDCGDDDDNQIP